MNGANRVLFDSRESGGGHNAAQLIVTYAPSSTSIPHTLTAGVAGGIATSVAAISSHALTASVAASAASSVTAANTHSLTAPIGATTDSQVAAISTHSLAAGLAGDPGSSVQVQRTHALSASVAAGIATTVTKTTTVILPIAKITDHTAQALDRLAEQFR
jgi:hypothetical protein